MIPHDNTWNAVFGYVKTEAYDLNNVQWVNGYVSTTGTPTSSANYMRTYAIRAGTFPNGCRLKFGAFSSYTLRVAEFNDTGESSVVKAANYIKSYPESGFSYEVEFEYDPTHCYAVTFGKFADAAARDAAKGNESFIRAIRCWVYEYSEPYYELTVGTHINGAYVNLGFQNLLSAKLERNVYPNNFIEVGKIASEKISFSTIGVGQIDNGYAAIGIKAISDVNPSLKSNEVFLGGFYIDSVTHNHGTDIYSYEGTPLSVISGVDIPYDYFESSFPTTPLKVYKNLVGQDGYIYKRDSETMVQLNTVQYSIPSYGTHKGAVYGTDMFRMIASAYGCNWMRGSFMDSDGSWKTCLKLVHVFTPYHDIDDEPLDVGKYASRIESSSSGLKLTGVQLTSDGEYTYSSGNETGYVLTVPCRFGTQAMADNILSAVSDAEYKGVIAYNVPNVTPLLELGDWVKIDGIETYVNYQVINFGPKITQTIGSKLMSISNKEKINSSRSEYATNESLGNGTAGLDVQEIIAKKIIIVDQYGNQHELSYMSKDSATMVLGF